MGPLNPLKWLFTMVYGCLETDRHLESWALLKSLKPGGQVSWLVSGDFNEILAHSVKQEGRKTWTREVIGGFSRDLASL